MKKKIKFNFQTTSKIIYLHYLCLRLTNNYKLWSFNDNYT